MTEKRIASIVPPNQAWPRDELEEMVQRWLQANVDAEKAGDWTKHLGPMYTDEAVYEWNIGPNEQFMANGRDEICNVALGYQMKGFEDWEYPYHDVVIDDQRGTVIGFWRQTSPFTRKDGSQICIEGIGGSWFEYAGNFQWKWQRDFFDFGNARETFMELAGMGVLNSTIKTKIQRQARGELLPGHVQLRPPLGPMKKFRNTMAMVKIALTGR